MAVAVAKAAAAGTGGIGGYVRNGQAFGQEFHRGGSLGFLHLVVRQFRTQLGAENRSAIMSGATTLVTIVGFAYSLAILVG